LPGLACHGPPASAPAAGITALHNHDQLFKSFEEFPYFLPVASFYNSTKTKQKGFAFFFLSLMFSSVCLFAFVAFGITSKKSLLGPMSRAFSHMISFGSFVI
jgi:hypothetical protein